MTELAVVRYEGAHSIHRPLLPEHYRVIGSVLNPYNELDVSGVYEPLHMLESLEEDKDGVLGDTVTTYYIPLDFNSVSKFGDSDDEPMTSHDDGGHDTGGESHTHAKRAHDPHGSDGHHNDTEDVHQNTGSGGHAHGEITAQINHASFRIPAANLLTQYDDIDPSTFCDVRDIDPKCKTTYCECTQVLYAEVGEVIELVLVDEGFGSDQSHPMHIHGHAFRVLAQEKKGDSLTVDHVIEMDGNGNIDRNLDSPPLKDTVAVPDGGYTIIRFNASNPGWWLFHCHLQFHLTVSCFVKAEGWRGGAVRGCQGEANHRVTETPRHNEIQLNALKTRPKQRTAIFKKQ
ncbi:putative laccase-2 [Apostichopus japonicus]|uniref:Putative laccase-2 n=1 Tax=Stichopus japonicus TaxID=307972 RepID=A0A2G8K6L7_STIJA|nr:putative laccase-2 [Apostichopus japonicus]